MTEIPEHLLKRSKERRAALGLPGGEGGDGGESHHAGTSAAADTGASSAGGHTPAGGSVEAPAPAPAAARSATRPSAPSPKPPPPLPPSVEAAQRRPKIPFWAMSVLVAMVPWAFMYMNSMQVPEVQDDVLALGEEVYAPCAGCHGGAGEGGTGPQLSGGEVLKTFKDPQDMMMWIHLGAEGGTREDGTYGDPDREGGARSIDDLAPEEMPAFPELTAEELAAVTRYVREELSGGEPVTEDVDLVAVADQAIEAAEAGELPSAGGDADEADATAQGGNTGSTGNNQDESGGSSSSEGSGDVEGQTAGGESTGGEGGGSGGGGDGGGGTDGSSGGEGGG